MFGLVDSTHAHIEKGLWQWEYMGTGLELLKIVTASHTAKSGLLGVSKQKVPTGNFIGRPLQYCHTSELKVYVQSESAEVYHILLWYC